MRRITRMWDIEDGKTYFLMQVRGGEVKTGIAKAEVKYSGHPIINNASIVFTITDGSDVPAGVVNDFDYIAEIDE